MCHVQWHSCRKYVSGLVLAYPPVNGLISQYEDHIFTCAFICAYICLRSYLNVFFTFRTVGWQCNCLLWLSLQGHEHRLQVTGLVKPWRELWWTQRWWMGGVWRADKADCGCVFRHLVVQPLPPNRSHCVAAVWCETGWGAQSHSQLYTEKECSLKGWVVRLRRVRAHHNVVCNCG